MVVRRRRCSKRWLGSPHCLTSRSRSPTRGALPRVQADGAYGNQPTQARAQRAGFRMQAPKRGENRQGVGKIRNAVERCHNFFAQFGRIFRRFDRSARRYLAWIEMAACIIFVRSGFVC
jgi:transposase